MKFHDLDEDYNLIRKLDTSKCINDFEYNGVNFFPLVRYHLLLRFKDSKSYFANAPNFTVRKLSLFQKLKAKAAFKSKLRKLKSYSNLFVSNLGYYTDEINSQKYNRHIDPLLSRSIKVGISSTTLDLRSKLEVGFTLNTYNKIVVVEDEEYWMIKRADRNTANFERLFKYFGDVFSKYELRLNLEKFVFDLNKVIEYSELYDAILKKIKPNKIFMVCWYDIDKMGLTMAAKKLKIQTFDIQHGKQGVKHHMYYHWSEKNDYKIVPDTVLTWGKESVDNILVAKKNTSILNPVVVGNLWANSWKNNNFGNEIKKWEIELKKLNEFEKSITFAIQPIEEKFQIDKIKFIAKQFPNYRIFVRLHPMMNNKGIFHELEGIHNIEVGLSTNCPLYFILEHSDALLTCWSTVALEASCFDVLPVIIHSVGAEIFGKNIENGELLYLKQNEELVNVLSDLENNKKRIKSTKFFEHIEDTYIKRIIS